MDDPQLFVIRVWHRPSFRAAVRVSDAADARWFGDAATLADYIAGGAGQPGPGPSEVPPTAHRTGGSDDETNR